MISIMNGNTLFVLMFIPNIYVCYEMFSDIFATGKLFFLEINQLEYTVKLSSRLNR